MILTIVVKMIYGVTYPNSLKLFVSKCTTFLKYCSHCKGVTVSPFHTGTETP